MKRSPDGRRAILATSFISATPKLGLAFLLFGCLLLLPVALGAKGGQEENCHRELDIPTCGRWHRGSGGADPLDLGAVKIAYRDVARRLDGAIAAFTVDLRETMKRPHSSGLSACRKAAQKTVRLGAKNRSRLRGKRMYFMDARDVRRLKLPKEVRDDAGVEIFILDSRSFLDLPEIAKKLRRPVNLASAAFARALGVRCANTFIRISERADEAYVSESK